MIAQYAGIPANITLEFAREWVEPRISKKRFKHVRGVVETAELLSERAGCDVFLAKLGGWLHDACKEMHANDLVAKAKELKVPTDPILEAHGYLLHGPVAAALARQELGITQQELLEAIAEHTLGAVPMSTLSKVLFLADCLEESRPSDYTDPIWDALDIKKSVNLDRALVVASNLGIMHLIESNKPIHPRTIDVRNYYLSLIEKSSG